MAATPKIGRLAGATTEAKALAKADAAQRAAAPRILSPNEMQGDYDASRLLTTTLGTGKGEQPRPLTADDLAAFRQNARALGQRFKGGISPRQVIDMSLAIDRKRAREEITQAVPAAARGAKDSNRKVDRLEVRFITNASKKYGATRHHVMVEFLGYSAAVASGALSASKAASLMRKQGIRFDCDCGRHQFWYRYVATVGNYNAGRAETGYPKVRNPGLTGVACKHVLRVMAEIEGAGMVQGFLARAIEKGRANEDGSGVIRTSQKEADKQAAKQATRPTARGANSGDRDFDRARAALRKASRATKTTPKRVAGGSKRIAALANEPAARDMLLGIIGQLGISREQAIAILKGAK